MMMELRHAGIVVADLDRARHFYCDLLGLKVLRSMEEDGAFLDNILGLKGVRVTTLKLAADQGSAVLELLKFHSPRTPAAPRRGLVELGPSHVAFTVEDLDALYARLTRAGVRFNAPPQLSPDGLAKVTFCYDPEGTPLELVEMLEVKP
jgi:catechol 2,3-dioxygenase-like lactoylglutathione lyase family enzyme